MIAIAKPLDSNPVAPSLDEVGSLPETPVRADTPRVTLVDDDYEGYSEELACLLRECPDVELVEKFPHVSDVEKALESGEVNVVIAGPCYIGTGAAFDRWFEEIEQAGHKVVRYRGLLTRNDELPQAFVNELIEAAE